MPHTSKLISLNAVIFIAIFASGHANSAEIPLGNHYRHLTNDGSGSPQSNVPNGTHAIDLGTISFDTTSTGTSSLALKSRANIGLDIDSTGANWTTTVACASSMAETTDSVVVQGIEDQSNGTIAFSFAVTGLSELDLDNTHGDIIQVHDLSALTTFTYSVGTEQQSGTLLEDFRSYANTTQAGSAGAGSNFLGHENCPATLQPEGAPATAPMVSQNENFDASFGASSGAVVLNVDWSADSTIPIHFQLTTSANLSLKSPNPDEVIFNAGVNADFGNTVRLVSAVVYDDSGNRINGAFVMGNNGAIPVPEPSVIVLLLPVLAVGFVINLRKKFNRASAS